MSVKIALVGNPNCGKTTLFNALTGSHQYVGNWPGVTVEKKSGLFKDHDGAEIVDLPGIYSLTPYSPEEAVARDFLTGAHKETRPDAVLNIVDGTNLERNLFLTTQLLELGLPVVIAVNMMDVVEKNGGRVDVDKLGKELGCAAIGISALKHTGVNEVAETAVGAAVSRKKTTPSNDRDTDNTDTPPPPLQEKFSSDEERYAHIHAVLKRCAAINTDKKHEPTISDKIDGVVTDSRLAFPIFAAVMFIMYFVSVTTVGSVVSDWANDGVLGGGWRLFGLWVPGIPVIAAHVLGSMNCADWLQGLIIDGVIAGVGAVLGFVPQLTVLFMFLAFLEGCGYMARAAFIMDGFFRRLGLSGKSFIPFLVGTGCSVPAVLAARTIENGRERRMTVLAAAFIPCSAKLPVIAMISGAVFGGAWWVAPTAYFAGAAAVVCSGRILKKTNVFGGVAAPFIMELPPYRLPTLKNVLRGTWERVWSFVKKAGTVILLASIAIWFSSNFGWSENGFGMAGMNDSVLAGIGRMFAWIFAPLGWGNWQAAVATITGLVAKENIVSTLGILYGGNAGISEDAIGLRSVIAADFNALSAYSFLLFNLLCAPCVAAVAAIRREMGDGKYFRLAIGYQCAFAYAASMCVYRIGSAFSGDFGLWTIASILLLAGIAYLMFRPAPKT